MQSSAAQHFIKCGGNLINGRQQHKSTSSFLLFVAPEAATHHLQQQQQHWESRRSNSGCCVCPDPTRIRMQYFSIWLLPIFPILNCLSLPRRWVGWMMMMCPAASVGWVAVCKEPDPFNRIQNEMQEMQTRKYGNPLSIINMKYLPDRQATCFMGVAPLAAT